MPGRQRGAVGSARVPPPRSRPGDHSAVHHGQRPSRRLRFRWRHLRIPPAAPHGGESATSVSPEQQVVAIPAGGGGRQPAQPIPAHHRCAAARAAGSWPDTRRPARSTPRPPASSPAAGSSASRCRSAAGRWAATAAGVPDPHALHAPPADVGLGSVRHRCQTPRWKKPMISATVAGHRPDAVEVAVMEVDGDVGATLRCSTSSLPCHWNTSTTVGSAPWSSHAQFRAKSPEYRGVVLDRRDQPPTDRTGG